MSDTINEDESKIVNVVLNLKQFDHRQNKYLLYYPILKIHLYYFI